MPREGPAMHASFMAASSLRMSPGKKEGISAAYGSLRPFAIRQGTTQYVPQNSVLGDFACSSVHMGRFFPAHVSLLSAAACARCAPTIQSADAWLCSLRACRLCCCLQRLLWGCPKPPWRSSQASHSPGPVKGDFCKAAGICPRLWATPCCAYWQCQCWACPCCAALRCPRTCLHLQHHLSS